jgi:hypothetical protein
MKLKVYVVDVELSPRVKKWAWRMGALLLVLGGAAVALAGPLHTWKTGDVLNADDLNRSFSDLDGRTTALEGKSGTLGGNAKNGYIQPPNWSYTAAGTSTSTWIPVWSGDITVPGAGPATLWVSLDGHWKVSEAWCYATVGIDGVALSAPDCKVTDGQCWGATLSELTTLHPIGFSAVTTIAPGPHSLSLMLMPATGTTCSANGVRLYWSTTPQ